MNQSRYREIEAAGQPRELGRQIGEAAREEIQGFVSIGLERVKKCCPVSRDSALRVARESARYAEAYSPDMVTELHGTAEAAGVPFKDLMLLQVRNQLKPDGDCGCTSFSIGTSRSASGGHVLGQNWDNDPALDPFTVVVTRRAQDRPAFICVTQAGLISYIGCNEVGIGVCLNTLPAPSREVGVPHYFTVRGMYEARSLQEAVAAVERAKRCIPANIMMASPEGPADLEVTLDSVHVLREEGQGYVTHTNHCLHPELLPINDDFPELIQSRPRLGRINQFLSESGGPLGIEVLKKALSDHENYPRSICRHPNEDEDTGFWATVFSVIIEADQGRLHVSRGNPCEAPYEVYEMN